MHYITLTRVLVLATAVLCPAASAFAQYAEPAWLVEAEYLNWRSHRSSLPFAGLLTFGANGSYDSELVETEFGRDSGFRFSVGRRSVDRWDVVFRYTFFQNSGATAVGDPTVDSDAIFCNLMDRSLADRRVDRNLDDGRADAARESISLDHFVYDLEFGRTLDFCGLSVRPFGGFRFAEIKQSASVLYQNFTPPAELDTYGIESDVDMTAWGIRGGGQVSHALFDCGLSLFGRGAASLMLADFRVQRTDVATDQPSGIAESRRHRHGYQAIVPQAELAAGLRYDYGRFFIAAGYELSYWFGMYQHLDVVGHDDVDDTTTPVRADRGDLSFDGWFVDAGLMF